MCSLAFAISIIEYRNKDREINGLLLSLHASIVLFVFVLSLILIFILIDDLLLLLDESIVFFYEAPELFLPATHSDKLALVCA